MIQKSDLEEQAKSLEAEREKALALVHRISGAIELCRMLLKKAEEPPDSQQETPPCPEKDNSNSA